MIIYFNDWLDIKNSDQVQDLIDRGIPEFEAQIGSESKTHTFKLWPEAGIYKNWALGKWATGTNGRKSVESKKNLYKELPYNKTQYYAGLPSASTQRKGFDFINGEEGESFECKYNPVKEALVFPMYDPSDTNTVINFQERWTDKENKRHFSFVSGVAKGFFCPFDSPIGSRKLLLLEGFFSTVAAYKIFGDKFHVLGVGGHTLTDVQIEMLDQYLISNDIEDIYVFLEYGVEKREWDDCLVNLKSNVRIVYFKNNRYDFCDVWERSLQKNSDFMTNFKIVGIKQDYSNPKHIFVGLGMGCGKTTSTISLLKNVLQDSESGYDHIIYSAYKVDTLKELSAEIPEHFDVWAGVSQTDISSHWEYDESHVIFCTHKSLQKILYNEEIDISRTLIIIDEEFDKTLIEYIKPDPENGIIDYTSKAREEFFDLEDNGMYLRYKMTWDNLINWRQCDVISLDGTGDLSTATLGFIVKKSVAEALEGLNNLSSIGLDRLKYWKDNLDKAVYNPKYTGEIRINTLNGFWNSKTLMRAKEDQLEKCMTIVCNDKREVESDLFVVIYKENVGLLYKIANELNLTNFKFVITKETADSSKKDFDEENERRVLAIERAKDKFLNAKQDLDIKMVIDKDSLAVISNAKSEKEFRGNALADSQVTLERFRISRKFKVSEQLLDDLKRLNDELAKSEKICWVTSAGASRGSNTFRYSKYAYIFAAVQQSGEDNMLKEAVSGLVQDYFRSVIRMIGSEYAYINVFVDKRLAKASLIYMFKRNDLYSTMKYSRGNYDVNNDRSVEYKKISDITSKNFSSCFYINDREEYNKQKEQYIRDTSNFVPMSIDLVEKMRSTGIDSLYTNELKALVDMNISDEQKARLWDEIRSREAQEKSSETFIK